MRTFGFLNILLYKNYTCISLSSQSWYGSDPMFSSSPQPVSIQSLLRCFVFLDRLRYFKGHMCSSYFLTGLGPPEG